MSLPFDIASHDKVLLFDGAMGTMLQAKGVPIGQSFDEANINQQDNRAERSRYIGEIGNIL